MQHRDIDSVYLSEATEGSNLYLSSMDQFYQLRLSQAIKPHRICFNAIIYITSGKGEHFIDYKKYSLKPGTVFFLSRYQVHQFCYNPSVAGFVLSFDDESLRLNQDDRGQDFMMTSLSSINTLEDEDLSLLSLFQAIQSEIISNNPFYSGEIVRTLLRTIMLKTVVRQYRSLMEHCSDHVGGNAYDQLKALIESEFLFSRNVSQYAAALGVTGKQLNKIARDNTGHTVKELLDIRLLQEIKRLLAFSNEPISEISQKTGFDVATNMAKFFRRHTQLSPRQFRLVCRLNGVNRA